MSSKTKLKFSNILKISILIASCFQEKFAWSMDSNICHLKMGKVTTGPKVGFQVFRVECGEAEDGFIKTSEKKHGLDLSVLTETLREGEKKGYSYCSEEKYDRSTVQLFLDRNETEKSEVIFWYIKILRKECKSPVTL